MILAISLALLLGAAAAQSEAGASPAAPEVVEAVQLRTRLGIAERPSRYTIYVHSGREHHLREDHISVATRAGDGSWTVDYVGETRGGLVRAEPELIPHESRVLTAPEGQRLDRLLRSPALYRQRSPRRGNVGVNDYWHTMEIVTSRRRMVVRWTGRLRGMAGQVADIVIGRPDADDE